MYDVAELLHERAGYVARGLKDRVKAVDAEIERISGLAVETAEPDAGLETPESGKAAKTRK
jgi:hypothetical protein